MTSPEPAAIPPQAIEIIAVGLVEYGLEPGENYYDPERVTEALPAAKRILEAAAPHQAAPFVAALERHMQWFTDGHGVKLCGGCLREYPCPDAALLRGEQP